MSIIWRKQYLSALNDSSNHLESDFIDLISKIIKNIKKNQQLLYKMIEQKTNHVIDPPDAFNRIDKIQEAIRVQKTLDCEKVQIDNVLNYRDQPYYRTKTYLYTILVRISEICEMSKQKYSYIKHSGLFNRYKTIKQEIIDDYNEMIQKKQLDIFFILSKFVKFQNSQIIKLLPKTIFRSPSPMKATLEPIEKTFAFQRAKTTQSLSAIKPIASLQITNKQRILRKMVQKNPQNKQKQHEEVSKSPNKLHRKRKSVSKSKKQVEPFAKIYSRNFSMLYKILQVKQIQVDESFFTRMEMERLMRQRNDKIKSTIREWDQQYQKNKQKIKLK